MNRIQNSTIWLPLWDRRDSIVPSEDPSGGTQVAFGVDFESNIEKMTRLLSRTLAHNLFMSIVVKFYIADRIVHAFATLKRQ